MPARWSWDGRKVKGAIAIPAGVDMTRFGMNAVAVGCLWFGVDSLLTLNTIPKGERSCATKRSTKQQ